MEKIKQITQETLLPIGFVITIIIGAFWLGELSAKVKQNSEKVDFCASQIGNLPSQFQYENLKEAIDEVRSDIKLLLNNE